MHADITEELKQMGEKRSTYAEQLRFLTSLSIQYQNIVRSAVDGHYEHSFFESIDTTRGFDESRNRRRVRAAVQHLNLQFASQMRQYGHRYRIWATKESAGTDSQDDSQQQELLEQYAEASALQETISREDAVKWVMEVLVRSRGRELPGTFNPLLMSQLFWEQSEHWASLAAAHVDLVDAVCSDVSRAAITSITFEDVSERLRAMRMDHALQTRHANAKEELRKLIEDKQRHPITYDPAFTASVQDYRTKKHSAIAEQLIDTAKSKREDPHTENSDVPADALRQHFQSTAQPDMDNTSAEDALDSQLAYYKVSISHPKSTSPLLSSLLLSSPTPSTLPSHLTSKTQDEAKFFIAAVTKQVVERHLLHGLDEHTLSPPVIADMSEDEVAAVAAESEETTATRDFLEHRRGILENGREAFRKALGAFR